MIRFFYIFTFVAILSVDFVAQSLPWKVEGEVDPKVLIAAQKRFKDLPSEQTTTNLLKFLGKRVAGSGGIEAVSDGDMITIRLIEGQFIKRVDVVKENLDLRRPLLLAMQEFHGQLFGPSMRRQILEKARKVAEENGYFRAVFDLSFNPSKRIASLLVEPKKPCVVHGLSGLAAPDELAFSVIQLKGEICNPQVLERRVSDHLRTLRDRGYFYQTLKVKDIRYFPNTNSAEIQFEGGLGLRSKFRIIEKGAFGWLKELFSGDLYEGLERLGVPPEELSDEIVKRLKLKGYLEASARYESQSSKNKENHVYYVSRGKRYKVKKIVFNRVGNRSEKEWKKKLGVRELISRKIFFSEERLERGSDSLESALRKDGYWQAVVKKPKTLSIDHDKKRASIVYEVNTGSKYIYSGRRIHLKGKQDLSENLLKKIKKVKGVRLGGEVQEADRSELQAQIFKLLRDHGYLYTKVKVDVSETVPEYHSQYVDPAAGKPVFFDLKIWPRKRVKIGEIRIKGLDITKRSVVERELLFASGDFYSQDVISRTRSSLQALGVFTNVRIQLEDPDMERRTTQVGILVDLQEVLPGSVSFGPGWSRLDGTRFQAEASYLNLGGANRQFFVRGGVSEERRQEPISDRSFLGRSISAGYTEPWVLGFPVDLLLTVSHQGRALDFWTLDYIGELAVRYKPRWLLSDTSITAFVRQKIAREVGTNILNDTLVSSGDVRISSYGLRVRADFRNDRSWPTLGIFFDGQVDQARNFLSGNTSYNHYDFLVSGYYPLSKKLSLAMHFHSAHFNKVERDGGAADVLPSAERAYLGGADTVRGFEERSLGPFVDGVDADFGASHRNILKAEMRYRLFKPVGVTAFMDFGNLYFSDEEADVLSSILKSTDNSLEANQVEGWHNFLESPEKFWKDQYVSYGLGLNAITPLGSLNFAYGIPLKAPDNAPCKPNSSNCPDDSQRHFLRGRFHLNFGVRF